MIFQVGAEFAAEMEKREENELKQKKIDVTNNEGKKAGFGYCGCWMLLAD